MAPPDALLDVLGGRVPFGYFSIPSSLAHVKAGKLVALGRERQCPFAFAAGGADDFRGWPHRVMRCRPGSACGRRPGTPAPVVEKIYAGVKTVLQRRRRAEAD